MRKVIPNHPEYSASEDGKIYGKHGKELKGHIDRCGYHEVLLTEHGKSKNYLAHRLILSTFKQIENPKIYQTNHINGIKNDNRIENLEWCTRSENLLHAYRTGLETKQCGEKHHAHKLTNEIVKDIRKTYIKSSRKYGGMALAKKYNVDRSTIGAIVNEETWKEIIDND